MADRFPLILNTNANQIQEIASGDSLDLTGTNIANAGIITAGNVIIGAASTDLIVNGDARITGILTIGTSSLKLDGPNNLVTVGTALTLGHTQGLQFHTQNLHSEGFEINQINLSGIATFNEARFANSKRLKFGDDIDLQIYHFPAGSGNNYISAANNTGIVVSAQNVSLMNQNHSAYFFKGEAAGSIVYHNNTARVTTTSTGINITGNNGVSGDLDVDGHTNLDNVSIAGVTTFAGSSTINNILYVKGAENTDGIIALYADEGDDNNDMWRLRAGANAAFYIDNYANGGWQTNLAATATSTQLYSAGYVKVNTTTNGINVYNGESGGTTTINVTKGSGDAEVVCQRTGGSGIKLRGSHPVSFLETTTDSDLFIRRNTSARIALGSNGNTIYGNTTFTGTVSIGGTLTYEDVTNIDSVGIVTARDGVFIPDIKELKIGNTAGSPDTKIFHNGSKTRLVSTVQYDMDADVIDIHNASANAMKARFLNNQVELYYANNKRFETTSTGIKVTGTTTTGSEFLGDFRVKGTDNSNFVTFKPSENLARWHDSDKAVFGNSNDLQLYHNATHSYLDNTTGKLHIRNNTGTYHGNGIHIEALKDEDSIVCNPNGAVKLYFDDNLKFQTISGGAAVTGDLGVGDASNPTHQYDQGIHVHANGTGAVLHLTDSTSGSGTGDGFDIISHAGSAYLWQRENANMIFGTQGTSRWSIYGSNGHFAPNANNTYDIGTTANRVRNLYVNDLQLSNKGKKDEGGNDVDGTWGDYTIQEGESDLYLINNRSGKKYKFNLTEVS